jgi:hypothetical protein
MSVGKAATELGREREFFSQNKFFSKMAHPTAFIVNSTKQRTFDKQFRAAIFIWGVGLALESMVTLVDFLFTHFPVPNRQRQKSLAALHRARWIADSGRKSLDAQEKLVGG